MDTAAGDASVRIPMVAEAEGSEPKKIEICGMKCDRNYALFLRLAAMIVDVALIIQQVFLLLGKLASFDLSDFFLSLYLIVFAFFCLLAELRFIECCRPCTYWCLKYIYFTSTYLGRGMFMVFLGSLLLTNVIGIVIGMAVILVGLTYIALTLLCPGRLPLYLDKQGAPVVSDLDGGGGGTEQPVYHYVESSPPPRPAGLPPAPAPVPQAAPPQAASRNPVNPFAAPAAPPQAAGETGADYHPPTTMDVAKLAYDHREHLTKENVEAGAAFYQKHKEHMTKENLDKAAKVAQVFSYK